MAFKALSTASRGHETTNAFVYGTHGAGKTTCFRGYQSTFGKGFVISGEGGLLSLATDDIDYLPFTSWDGAHDPDNGVYSFRGICRMIASPDFKAAGYKWIGLDSLTEVSDRLTEYLEDKYAGISDGFAKHAEFGKLIVGSLKWLRDLPYHCLVTCLAKEKTSKPGDEAPEAFLPMVSGKLAPRQIPGIFDTVIAIERESVTVGDDIKVRRRIITDKVGPWDCKIRDPHGLIPPVLPMTSPGVAGADIAELMAMLCKDRPTVEAWLASMTAGATPAP